MYGFHWKMKVSLLLLRLVEQWKKGPWLVTQLYGDYFINHEIRIPSLTNQYFNGKYSPGFFRGIFVAFCLFFGHFPLVQLQRTWGFLGATEMQKGRYIAIGPTILPMISRSCVINHHVLSLTTLLDFENNADLQLSMFCTSFLIFCWPFLMLFSTSFIIHTTFHGVFCLQTKNWGCIFQEAYVLLSISNPCAI